MPDTMTLYRKPSMMRNGRDHGPVFHIRRAALSRWRALNEACFFEYIAVSEKRLTRRLGHDRPSSFSLPEEATSVTWFGVVPEQPAMCASLWAMDGEDGKGRWFWVVV